MFKSLSLTTFLPTIFSAKILVDTFFVSKASITRPDFRIVTLFAISLISIKKLLVELDLMKILFDGKYEIKKLALNQPQFHIKVLDDGTCNSNNHIYVPAIHSIHISTTSLSDAYQKS